MPDPVSAPSRSEADLAEEVEKNEHLDRLLEAPATHCLNCGADLPGDFCPDCGQKDQPLRQSVPHYLRDSFAEFFGLDGRVWPSFGALLFKPGTLTRAYLAGRRQRYLRPLRIYLTATLAFFVLLSVIDPIGRIRDDIMSSTSSEGDSVRVAVHQADNDAILADGLAGLVDDQRELAAAIEARADSLRLALAEAEGAEAEATRAELSDLGSMMHDSLEHAGDHFAENLSDAVLQLKRARIEAAILEAMPPDSVISLDNLHDATAMLYPDTVSHISGPSWLLRNEALQRWGQAQTGREKEAALTSFVRAGIGYVPTVMFLILPLFALFLKVLYVRRGWYYSEHVVFGLHTHAFAFVVFSLVSLMLWTAIGADGWVKVVAGALTNVLLVSIPLYFLVAMKRVYRQGWIRTVVKAVLLGVVYNVALFFGILGAFLLAAVLG